MGVADTSGGRRWHIRFTRRQAVLAALALALGTLAVPAAPPALATPAGIERIALTANGKPVYLAGPATMSADGRYIAALVSKTPAGRTDGTTLQCCFLPRSYVVSPSMGSLEVVLYDRVARTGKFVTSGEEAGPPATTVASPTRGVPGADISTLSLSRDGRYLVFDSSYSNLVPGHTGDHNVFLYDRLTGRNSLAVGDGSPLAGQRWGIISPDASTIVVRAGVNGTWVAPRRTKKYRLIMPKANDLFDDVQNSAKLSDNGRYLGFQCSCGYTRAAQTMRVDMRTGRYININDGPSSYFQGMDGRGNTFAMSIDSSAAAYSWDCRVMVKNLTTGKAQVFSPSGAEGENACTSAAGLSGNGAAVAYLEYDNAASHVHSGTDLVDTSLPSALRRVDLLTGVSWTEPQELPVSAACLVNGDVRCPTQYTNKPVFTSDGASYLFGTVQHLTSDDTDRNPDLYVRTL